MYEMTCRQGNRGARANSLGATTLRSPAAAGQVVPVSTAAAA